MKVKGLNFCCDVMYMNTKVGRLEIVNGKLIKNEVYTDNIMEHPFPNSHTLMDILGILKNRVICKERFDDDLKRMTGIKEYNVYDLLHNTHGVDIDDFTWFKFDGEDITWNDVRVR